MKAIETLWREINDAAIQMRPIQHIRVTTDAFAGSPSVAPISPERARQVRLLAIPAYNGDISVVADPEVVARTLELLVHPKDWYDALHEMSCNPAHFPNATEFMGIKVIR